jgi:hypothetical protein
MTSQVNLQFLGTKHNCWEREDVPTEYCHKLRSGIIRLQNAIQLQYEKSFPAAAEQIARAICEAEVAAWGTPFPALFFPTLAHLRVREILLAA